jgi:hypothetical protein
MNSTSTRLIPFTSTSFSLSPQSFPLLLPTLLLLCLLHALIRTLISKSFQRFQAFCSLCFMDLLNQSFYFSFQQPSTVTLFPCSLKICRLLLSAVSSHFWCLHSHMLNVVQCFHLGERHLSLHCFESELEWFQIFLYKPPITMESIPPMKLDSHLLYL